MAAMATRASTAMAMPKIIKPRESPRDVGSSFLVGVVEEPDPVAAIMGKCWPISREEGVPYCSYFDIGGADRARGGEVEVVRATS